MIRWMFTHIDVSRRPHCAVHHLTGDTPSRASPDACRPPPHALWLSAGVPYLIIVCGRPNPDGDCGLSVLLALQCVPDRAGLSRWEPRNTCRPRRPALYCRAADRLNPLAHALPGRRPQSCPAYIWLVPHPVELCHPCSDAPGQTRDRGVSGNRAPLAPRDGLGMETGQTGSER